MNGTPANDFLDGTTTNDFWPVIALGGGGSGVGGPFVDLSGSTTDESHKFFTTIIPEPSGLTLLALGGLAMLRRRRGKAD